MGGRSIARGFAVACAGAFVALCQAPADPNGCLGGWFSRNVPVNELPSASAAMAEVEKWRLRNIDCPMHLLYFRNRDLDSSAFFSNGYQFQRFLAQTHRPTELEAVDVVEDSNGWVVRLRSGENLETNTTGANPLLLRSGKGEIVFVGRLAGEPRVAHLALYFVRTAHPLSEGFGLDVDEEIRARFGQDSVLHLRNDTCFLGDPGYPAINPFVEDPPTLTCATAAQRAAVWCGMSKAGKRVCELSPGH
jgi:hypothetical protein